MKAYIEIAIDELAKAFPELYGDIGRDLVRDSVLGIYRGKTASEIPADIVGLLVETLGAMEDPAFPLLLPAVLMGYLRYRPDRLENVVWALVGIDRNDDKQAEREKRSRQYCRDVFATYTEEQHLAIDRALAVLIRLTVAWDYDGRVAIALGIIRKDLGHTLGQPFYSEIPYFDDDDDEDDE